MSANAALSSSHSHSAFVAPPSHIARQAQFSEEASADYVLHYGFQADRHARQRQDDAFFRVQRKVVVREDAAHALLLSANGLAMSVMASQLTMYRWKVSEAQTVDEAMMQLQEMVNSATRRGLQVRREQPKPLKLSKYADGEGLKRLYEKNMMKLERRRQRREAAANAGKGPRRTQAAASSAGASAADSLGGADAMYDTLLRSSSSSSNSSDFSDSHPERATGDGTHTHSHRRRVSRSSSLSACSADADGPNDGRRMLPPAPPDAIPRLVLVDRFTHESFGDIAQNLRFFDERYGLQLVLVLLLPEDSDATTVQGAGAVVTPQHDITAEEAYAAGYDLVLRHHFDHIVVNFLSHVFVSSAGRWRSDIRAKAAVGNYLSLKNVLLGRIDTEALQQLVWRENVDDAELLQQLGSRTLALHGEAKRYGMAGQRLNRQVPEAACESVGADVLITEDPEEKPREGGGSSVLGGLPRLRTGYTALGSSTGMGGVRIANQRAILPLDGLTITKDELQHNMDPSDRVQHSVKQLRQNGNPLDDASYDYTLIDEKEENRVLLMTAIEEEMTRLVAENEHKSTAMRHLQEDVTRLQRTVEVLRRQRASGPGGGRPGSFDGDGGNGVAPSGAPGQRPDSGSLVNLTKEQQIYVLKERLDQANDQIVALLDGTGRVRPSSGSRRTGSGSRAGTRGHPGSRGGGSNSSGNRRLLAQEKARAQAYRRYHEHREAEMMSAQDEDALWKDSRLSGYAASTLLTVTGGNVSRPGSPRRAMDPTDLAAQRREREMTHKVVLQLQAELTQMHARVGNDAPDATARLIHRMEEALKRLEAQKARITQLEELRRMDEAFFEAELKRAKPKSAGAGRGTGGGGGGGGGSGGGGVGDQGASGGTENAVNKKGGKTRKTKKSSNGPPASPTTSAPRPQAVTTASDDEDTEAQAGGRGAGAGGQPPQAAGKTKAPQTTSTSGGTGGISAEAHTQALEALRIAVKAECDAEQEVATVQLLREQRARELALRTHLGRVYHHMRQPCTQSYARLLEDQQASAEAHAKEVRYRLVFALSHMKEHQLHASHAKKGDDGIISRIADPVAREQVEALAGEYAHYAAQAAEAQRRLEVLRPQLAPENVQAHVSHLTAQRETSYAAMMAAASAPDGTLDAYLATVEALQQVDQQLALWMDVDVEGTLRAYASAAHDTSATGSAPSSLAAATTSVAPPPPLPTDDNTSAVHSPSLQPVSITVADLALREVAEAYRAATTDSQRKSDARRTRKRPADKGGAGKKSTNAGGRGGSGQTHKSTGRPSSTSARPSSGASERDGERHRSDTHPLRPRNETARDSRGSSCDSPLQGEQAHERDSSPAPSRVDREAPQAHVSALVGHGTDVLAALEDGVARGWLSRTQQRWYGLLLDRYARGYIHPDRMMDLDKVATAVGPAGENAVGLGGTKGVLGVGSDGDCDDGDAESDLARAKRIYLSLHREVQRLLMTLTAHFPALTPLVAICTPRVEAGLEEELLRTPPPCVSPVFMAAADAARLTWVIDYMVRVLQRVHSTAVTSKARARAPTGEDDAVLAMVKAVQAQEAIYHVHPQDPLVAAYSARCAAVVAQYEDGEGGWWASPSQVGGAASTYEHGISPTADDLEGVQAYLDAKHAELGVDPEALGYTADDLAALFSRKMKDQQDLAELLPSDLYEALDSSDDPAYAEMMLGIRGELEYLNALKQQRMEELVLQYRLRQRQRGEGGEKNVYEGRGDGDGRGNPYEGRAVPEFEIKEGEPGWYGMQAARRVKDILRRKRKPDQIVLDGGPGGGNVGIELSRRTAFPLAPPRDISLVQSAQDRLKAARTAALPPLRSAGMNHQQQRLAASGYSPRDVSTYNAYQRVLTHAEFGAQPQAHPNETPALLAQRSLLYRAIVGPGAPHNAWVEQQLGAPYYVPIAAAGDERLSSPIPTTGAMAPALTTWTYGLPSEQLEAMLKVPIAPDGRNATTTVVLPHEANSHLAREATTVNPQRRTVGSRRQGDVSASPWRTNHGFISGVGAYTSPAALAAQRLSTMLHMSMEDPTVAALTRLARRAEPGARRGDRTTAPATQYADLAQARRASRYAEHRRMSQMVPAAVESSTSPPAPRSAHTPAPTRNAALSPSPPPLQGRQPFTPPAGRRPPSSHGSPESK